QSWCGSFWKPVCNQNCGINRLWASPKRRSLAIGTSFRRQAEKAIWSGRLALHRMARVFAQINRNLLTEITKAARVARPSCLLLFLRRTLLNARARNWRLSGRLLLLQHQLALLHFL